MGKKLRSNPRCRRYLNLFEESVSTLLNRQIAKTYDPLGRLEVVHGVGSKYSRNALTLVEEKCMDKLQWQDHFELSYQGLGIT
jgi:hypothetical protein